MIRGPDDQMELNHLAERLGSRLLATEPIGWGDARATHRLSLADGRRFAARRFAGREAHARAERIGGVMTRLAQAGLPVPAPISVDADDGAWLLTAWVEGETGAALLGDPDRAQHLADRMGRLARQLRTFGLGRVADPTGRVAFVHGDFAPVNVIMRADGEIGALVDFEHAGAGPALLDVAWWGWVVRHHHPDVWTVAWPTFLASAGLEPGHLEPILHELVLQTLADRAAGSDDPEARAQWQRRLSAARAWSVPGAQAT